MRGQVSVAGWRGVDVPARGAGACSSRSAAPRCSARPRAATGRANCVAMISATTPAARARKRTSRSSAPSAANPTCSRRADRRGATARSRAASAPIASARRARHRSRSGSSRSLRACIPGLRRLAASSWCGLRPAATRRPRLSLQSSAGSYLPPLRHHRLMGEYTVAVRPGDGDANHHLDYSDDRMLLMLRRSGLSFAQIGRRLGKTSRSVASRCYRTEGIVFNPEKSNTESRR